jgi:phosphohistidine phosphatase
MLLYVMRHGPAEDRAATGRDADRALTREGREVVRRAARELVKARGTLGSTRAWALRILSSPARRACETAETIAGELSAHASAPRSGPTPGDAGLCHRTPGPLDIEVHDDLSVDAPLPLHLIAALGEAGVDTLLVSHQPAVEELARTLAHPERVPLASGFRTATIVALEHVGGAASWRFAWVVDPHRPPG